MIYIGIDIGKSGYIVCIADDAIGKHQIPLIGDEVDDKALAEIFEMYSKTKCIVYMEDLHSIYGVSASSNFSFGHINGLIQGMLVAYKIPFIKISAKKWQKEMFEGIPMQFKMNKGKQKVDTKAMSILASKRLYPNFDLRISDRGRVDNHNVSDALLIASYGRKHCKI